MLSGRQHQQQRAKHYAHQPRHAAQRQPFAEKRTRL